MHHLDRPLDGVYASGFAATVGEDFPTRGLIFFADALGVDGDDDALHAVAAGGLRYEVRIVHRGGIDADLIRPGSQQAFDVRTGAHATANGERDVNLAGDGFYRRE